MKAGFELILPFLRPIESTILDPAVSEVMVNSTGDHTPVFVEKAGVMRELEGVTIAEKQLQIACRHIARLVGEDISEERPILDARLPDGSRVAAMFPPCSVGGTTLTIRKFERHRYSLRELIRIGTLSQELADTLFTAVRSRHNILISGGTSTGKTTLLNALASCIPDKERIITIEDTAEIHLEHSNLRRFEARRKQDHLDEISMGTLLRASLRHRPDRLILGEVRGGEAFDLLQALNTGHSGSLSTIHANSAAQALSRLENCVLESKVDLPYRAIQANIGDSIGLLVHIEKRAGTRRVSQVLRVKRFDHAKNSYELEPVYAPVGDGAATTSAPKGEGA